MAVLVGINSIIIALELAGKEKLYTAGTGGQYLVTGRKYPDQTSHNSFEDPKGRSPELHVLVSGSKAIYVVVCPTSHTHVHYLIAEEMKLAHPLHVE